MTSVGTFAKVFIWLAVNGKVSGFVVVQDPPGSIDTMPLMALVLTSAVFSGKNPDLECPIITAPPS